MRRYVYRRPTDFPSQHTLLASLMHAQSHIYFGERWTNPAGVDAPWTGTSITGSATLDDDKLSSAVGGRPWWGSECMECVTTATEQCFRYYNLPATMIDSYITFDMQVVSSSLTSGQVCLLMQSFDNVVAADADRMMTVILQNTGSGHRLIVNHYNDDTERSVAQQLGLYLGNISFRVGLMWDGTNNIAEIRIDNEIILDNSTISARGPLAYVRLGPSPSLNAVNIVFDNFVIRDDRYDLPTQIREAPIQNCNWLETLENADDYDMSWPEGDLGANNTMSPNASVSAISAPASWGTEGLKLVFGATDFGAIRRRTGFPTMRQKMFQRLDFYIEDAASWPNDAEGNLCVVKKTQRPDDAVSFPEIHKDSVRGLHLRWRYPATGYLLTVTLPSGSLSEGIFYTIFVKIDWVDGYYAMWLSTSGATPVLLHTGCILSNWPAEVNVITLGASGGAGVQNSTYWLNNFAISTEGWPEPPYKYVGLDPVPAPMMF